MKRFVIIGMSAASVAFVVKLRSFDKDSEIICFSGEKDFPYNRCFLADFITDEKNKETLQLKPQEFFQQQNIQLHLDSWVTQIDTKNKLVVVKDENISYDYLFIGTGTRPFIPTLEGLEYVKNVHTFHTLQDAKNIKDSIEKQHPRVAVVIGAGINGIECASSLRDMGLVVIIIERSDRILSQQVDTELAEHIHQRLQTKGVTFISSASAEVILSENKDVFGVQLSTGTKINADLVVIAAGSKLNSELLQNTDIALEKGAILVDERGKTSVENIYAAGDICRVKDAVTGEVVQSATWSDAMLQGLCVATQFSSKPRNYPGIIGLRDSYFFEQLFYACGNTVSHDDSVKIVKKQDDENVRILYLKGNVVKGFVLLGNNEKLAQYKQWYMTQCILSEEDTKDF